MRHGKSGANETSLHRPRPRPPPWPRPQPQPRPSVRLNRNPKETLLVQYCTVTLICVGDGGDKVILLRIPKDKVEVSPYSLNSRRWIKTPAVGAPARRGGGFALSLDPAVPPVLEFFPFVCPCLDSIRTALLRAKAGLGARALEATPLEYEGETWLEGCWHTLALHETDANWISGFFGNYRIS